MKIRVPLPPGDPSGGEAEWLWAEPKGLNTFVVRNVPIFVFGLSFGDEITAIRRDGDLVLGEVISRGGHSTYRIYAKTSRHSPEIQHILQRLKEMHCEMEAATSKIVGVDVLPTANIYDVYRTLQEAEAAGILEFEEGHCGHVLEG